MIGQCDTDPRPVGRSRRAVLGCAAVIAAALSPRAARAADPEDVTGVVFVAQPVRGPVAPDRVSPVLPFVPPDVAEQTGAIAIGPDRAATLWLDPLDVIRVRGDQLRFARVIGDAGARARLDEPGAVIAPGTTYLSQPPGRGDVWMIWADRATTIRVERPLARDGRLIWDATQRAVLDWIDAAGARSGGAPERHPAIPVSDGAYGAALALEADAVVGAAIEAKFPGVKKAVRAWRKAGALAALTRVRPLIVPQLGVTPLDDLPGMGDDVTVPDPTVPDPRPYQRLTGPKQLTVELAGPGVLRVEVRAVLPPITTRQLEPPTVTVAVVAAGQQLARRSVAAAYATAPAPTFPPPAFPAKQPLRSVEGDYLGDRVAVSVPLFPGKHTYQIGLEGGPLAIRATAARRRVRLGEWLTGSDDVDHYVRDALRALGTDTSDGANLVRHLVGMRTGSTTRGRRPPAAELPPLLRLAWLVAAGDLDDRAAMRTTMAAQPTPAGVAVWALVLELARRLHGGDDVRELYRAVRGAPPSSLVPELTDLLPRSTPLERVRSWSLAAVDVAARTRPLDPAVAAAARAEWRTGEWALIRPTLRDPDAEPPVPQRWLAEIRPTPMVPPRAWQPGDLTRLVPGKPRVVIAQPSAIDGSRAALLEVFVATPGDDPGPIQVTVDGHAFHAFALAPVERLQLAVAPGKHEVAIAGPAGLKSWVSQLPAASVAIEDTARVQHYWPTELEGARVQYVLPAGELSIPIEVALRATGATAKPIHVTINCDVGRPIELDLATTATDATAYALEVAAGDRPAVDEARFVLRLPPGARVVWLETSAPTRVFAAVSARRERFAPPVDPAAKPASSVDLVGRVAAASRALAADPDDPHLRASRANDLLDLGEAGLAREDLIRLLRVPATRRDNSLAGVEEELFTRLDNFAEPTHVALAGGAPRDPIAVAPGVLAVATGANLAAWRPAAIALRTKGPDAALRLVGAAAGDPVASYLAARAHAARGDDPAAAQELMRIYQRTDSWQVGFDAIDVLSRVLADRKRPPRAGLISITYGIASRIRAAIDHPRLRRALVVAASQSGWDTITATSGNAGQEHLFSSAPILPPAPAVVVREALLSPRWPARSAHTLTAGNAAILDLTVAGTASLRAQIHCVRVRGATPGAPGARSSEAPCALTARLDNGAAKPLAVPINATTQVALEPVGTGRHVIEVALAAASDGDVASVRFVSERALAGLTAPADPDGQFPIRIDRRAKVFVATATTPITATVLGPATLWVQGRAVAPGPQGATAIAVVATPRKGDPVRATLPLAAERDPDARGDTGRDLAASAPGDVFLVLPEAGPYQITVRPDRGEAVSRMALRDERKGKIPRLPGPWYLAAPLPAAPFAVPTPPAASSVGGVEFAPPETGRAGTWSIDVGANQDSRSEEDVTTERVFARIEGGLGFRRALSPQRAWWSARALIRSREQTALIAGGSTELYLDHLPLGTTVDVTGTAFTQRFSGGQAWHARGDLRLLRRFAASDTVTVIPSLGFAASYMNTTPQIASEADNEEIDPDVYNLYRYTHELAGTARLAVRWMPLQDVLGFAALGTTANASFRSLDNAAVSIGSRFLLPLPVLGETLLDLSYRPSYRFADADRVDAYWRHDVSARLEWTLWTGTAGRFVLSIWDDALFASASNRNAAGATLRFDLVRHRGLADFLPDDSPFASLVEHRCYAPLDPR